MIIEQPEYRNKNRLFDSREQAGLELAKLIQDEDFDVLFIIPNGGLPVGYSLFQSIKPQINEFDLLIVRKVQTPWSTEAGMGAVTPDGQIFLNHRIVNGYSIKDKELEIQIDLAKNKIVDLRKEFNLADTTDIIGKKVLVVDDGIASGFSMLAGSEWLKSLGASEVVVGVPTAPLSSLHVLIQNISKIYCLNIREGFSFAVADAYTNWYDLSLPEAKDYVRKLNSLK